MAAIASAFLERVSVFSLLSRDDVERVTAHLASVDLAEGETLFHEGEPGNEMYILAEGRVAISIRLPGGAEQQIAQFAPGDFFGEMSIFDNAPRSATCRALIPSVVFRLSKDAFSVIIAQHPRIALKLMYRMLNVTTQRLRDTSQFVSEMVLWGESARKRAITDELTGVYNRRFLEDSLGGYVSEAREKGTPLSLVMVDLDHFREINEVHGQQKGDETIRSAATVFRSMLHEKGVIARYGGDEFVIILPGTGSAEAIRLMTRVCEEVALLDTLKDPKGAVIRVTSSMGIASFPEHAADLSALRAAADAALYQAKEEGRNRVVGARVIRPPGPKTAIRSIRQKNLIIANIIDAIMTRRRFVILGHHTPDDDCISSMISFALVLHMFYRDVFLYFGGQLHERFHYLLEICRYNSIPILGPADSLPPGVDTVVLCDTPKPDMIAESAALRAAIAEPGVLRIEIDHHLGGDSAYFGDEGYRLVTEASSASELIGHILLKLRGRRDLLDRHQVTELFPRNLVLAILTGIIGDSNMGQYLKSSREKRYYAVFSAMFNDLLSRRTTKKTNFFTADQLYSELQKLSNNEEGCFRAMMSRKRSSPSIAYVALNEQESAPLFSDCDDDTVVSTARVVADKLAEQSGKLGLVVYRDNPEKSALYQFRLRRAGGWKQYDLRNFLTVFSIMNGGGHEGAIGFRVPLDEVPDFEAYVRRLVQGIEDEVSRVSQNA
ncbi:MAG TPA: diguanylate cyclase [Spirochaetia bacterium]|nr:diguanylate cyclase [Spirochaetia bacterium]